MGGRQGAASPATAASAASAATGASAASECRTRKRPSASERTKPGGRGGGPLDGEELEELGRERAAGLVPAPSGHLVTARKAAVGPAWCRRHQGLARRNRVLAPLDSAREQSGRRRAGIEAEAVWVCAAPPWILQLHEYLEQRLHVRRSLCWVCAE